MPNETKGERISDNVLISDVSFIGEGGVTATTKESLAKLVEPPLLEACEDLYYKNIETVMSSANAKDVGGEGHIMIALDTLSDENKEVALKFGELKKIAGTKECVTITFQISADTTVGDVRKTAHEIVTQFHKQELNWGRTTLKDIARAYGIPAEDLSPESFPEKYYDAGTGYLYDSEELYQKAKDSVK